VDEHGSASTLRHSVVIDLAAEEGILYLGRKDINDVANRLEDISKTLEHLASGYKKPLVRTISEQEHERKEAAWIAELKQAGAQEPDASQETYDLSRREIYPRRCGSRRLSLDQGMRLNIPTFPTHSPSRGPSKTGPIRGESRNE
jgi:hypothetical protein